MDKTEVASIANALRQSPPSKSELTELIRLYSTPGGFPYMMDVGGRPQAETLGQCRRVGSRVNRQMGSPHHYGMNVVGNCHVSSGTWRMRPEFRAAMELARLVVPSRSAVHEDGEGDEDLAATIEADIRRDATLTETEREQLIRARVGQGKFRQAVRAYESACRVTGVSQPDLLQACHMKPWMVSSNAERLDGANGLMLAPSMHALFDKGYISFDASGRIHVSSTLPVDVLQAWNVVQRAKPKPFAEDQLVFLQHHQAKVYRG